MRTIAASAVVAAFEAHARSIDSLVVRRDCCRRLACVIRCEQVWTASMDGRLYVYSCRAPGELSSVRPLSADSMRSGVRTLLYTQDLIFSGSEDGNVAIWDVVQERAQAAVHSVHNNIVSTLCDVGGQVRAT